MFSQQTTLQSYYFEQFLENNYCGGTPGDYSVSTSCIESIESLRIDGTCNWPPSMNGSTPWMSDYETQDLMNDLEYLINLDTLALNLSLIHI